MTKIHVYVIAERVIFSFFASSIFFFVKIHFSVNLLHTSFTSDMGRIIATGPFICPCIQSFVFALLVLRKDVIGWRSHAVESTLKKSTFLEIKNLEEYAIKGSALKSLCLTSSF